MSRINTLNFRLGLFLSGVIIFLVGCSNMGLENIEAPSLRTPQPVTSSDPQNDSAIITMTPTSSLALTTPTRTFSPTVTTISQLMSSPTWTPIPSLSADEAIETILDLYKDNGGCELPCWWGIHPGKTSWKAAREKLSPIGLVSGKSIGKNLEIYEFDFIIPVEADSLGLGFIDSTLWVKDGFVTAISSNVGWINKYFDYSLSGLLKTLGQPEEIWIKVNTDTMDLPHYELDLFYPSKGIRLNSTGDASAENNGSVTICPKEFRRGEFPPAILLWDASIEHTYKNLSAVLLGGSREIGGEGFDLLENVAVDFDEAEFFNTYQNVSTNRCIEIDVAKLEQ